MLISNDHRFIFVHIPKTAGLSITDALQPYAENNPRKGWRRLLSHLPVPEDPHKAAFRVHVSARWARLKLPAAVFDSYCKFAVVRNPYDRAVSYFHFLTQKTDHHRHHKVRDLTFPQYLDHVAEQRRNDTQFDCVADKDGRLLIDKVLRIETLDADFAALCADLGLSGVRPLPQHNTSKRGDYLEYFGDEGVRRKVAELFAVDFEAFGYDLDPKVRQAVAAPKSKL